MFQIVLPTHKSLFKVKLASKAVNVFSTPRRNASDIEAGVFQLCVGIISASSILGLGER